ncbi:hypothetical protein BA6E_104112 [Bacteroidales bacterium 6E]|nr:hypothetical protein BA6E_104112 [Bacteroidales bacterium 6E]
MNKNGIISVVAALAAIMVVIAVYELYLIRQKTDQLTQMETQNFNLSENIQDRDSVINDFVSTFNEIDENLTFIHQRRNQLTLEASKEINSNRKSEILADIRLMDSMLVASSKHIEDLEKRLKDSGVRMRSFENRIASLNQTITQNTAEMEELRRVVEEKDFQIAELSTRLDQYQTELDVKNEELYNKEMDILETNRQMNTAYYALGSYKELKEQGIVDRTGGLLGIGSTKTIQQNLQNEYFTPLDIREIKTIPIASKSAKIITEHPDDSYELIMEDGLISALVIEKPEEFWKISKYAVIETR